jgi:micrococcal nuclease
MGRVRLPVAIFILLAAVGSVWAADLRVAVVSLSSPVAPFSDATLEIQTAPGAACVIAVRYKSGPSRARGLVPKTADGKGRVAWLWRVGSNTTPGQWPIEVTCEKGAARGSLRTTFEVR